jgi:hypothetical protein
MSLLVFSSRIGCKDPDVFDISRMTGGVEGAPFAPSWEILRPALDERKKARMTAMSALSEPVWGRYRNLYRLEMRDSYGRLHRAAWDKLLARERVVLCCYCALPREPPDSDGSKPRELQCHRILCAGYLVALGAKYMGELPVVA